MSIVRKVRVLGTLAVSIFCSGTIRASTINTTDGPVTVTSAVTPIGGGLFQYDYTVADGTGLLAVLDIAVTPGVAISNLTAPGGSSAFTSTIDTVGSGSTEQEFVSFLENNGVFSASPEDGFMFDSPVPAAPTTFGITLFDPNVAPATAGGIQGPVTPEPASLMLFASGLAGLVFLRKRLLASRHR
jgi:hypothetical protein